MNLELIKAIARRSPTKIVLVVIDGLGGLPDPETGKTELETARTPNLDQLAANGICGLIDLVGPGITPGSAPGHLALFGYHPVTFNIGRGILEAIGIDFDLQQGDVAARGNFCTVDEASLVTDRRAGRISTEECAKLCQLLDGLVIDKVKLFVCPVREHRFVVVFRGDDLSANVSDSDPQQVGTTGATVAPKLYVACGISGASQHIAGMRGSGFVVAINRDPGAAIFNVADVCVVEDLITFIPCLIEEHRKQSI